MTYWDVVTGRQTWSDYVTTQDLSSVFHNALQAQTRALTKANAQIALSQSDYQIALQSGLGALDESVSGGLANVTNKIEVGFDRLQNGLDALNADFNLMMGDIIWKLEMLHVDLNNILQEIRLAEFERAARAFRIRGEDSYRNEWYDKALIDFLEAEKRNYKDFAVLRSIANIYLYHLIDLPKSLEYFLKTARYSRPNDSRQSAAAEYYAGIVCSVQQNIKDASAHMLEATVLNPKFYQAFYMHAKFAAMLNDPAVAVRSLEKAIRGDPRYHERAKTEQAFNNAWPQLYSLLDVLMREIRERAESANKTLQAFHGRCGNLLPEDKLKFAQVLDNAERQLAQAQTYNDFYQFVFVPQNIEPGLRSAEQRRDEKIRLDQEQVDGLTQEIGAENDEIASGWKHVGFGLLALAGVYLASEICAKLCNQRFDSPQSVASALGGILLALLAAIGCLGVIVFSLVFWLGIVVVIAMIFWQIVKTAGALIRVGKLKSEIDHFEANRWKRE